MSRRLFYGVSVLISILVLFLAWLITLSPSLKSPPAIIGRANVVLFLVNSEAGLSNVFAATAKSLLEQHPTVTVHFASFAPLAPQLERISSYIRTKNPSNAAPDIIFHQLPDLTLTRAIRSSGRTMSNMAHRPGLGGIDQICRDIQFYVSP
ncbi:glycosyltransferase family 1 protein [Hypoxylon fuscum]|nr:glycosyltransferase family 1 protein [Hypoxylon fuscum]